MDNLQYRGKILKVCRELTQENVSAIKFCLKGDIGEGVLENIKTSLDLFETLGRLGWIGPGKYDYLVELLKAIDRTDISNLLQGIPAGTNAPDIISPGKVKAKDPIPHAILDLVATHIAGDWKRLGRYLDLQEAKIEGIDLDYRKAYEKATQTIRVWMTSCNASWELLRKALEELPRYDIIRLVEGNFPNLNAPAAPAEPPDDPAIPGHPAGIAQASSVDENAQYSAASNLQNNYPPMEKPSSLLNNMLPDSDEHVATTTIAENHRLPDSVETVLTIDRNRANSSDEFDTHLINS